MRDESARATAEATQAASAELLHTIVEDSPIGMGVADPDHRWIQTNPALRHMLAISEEETVGHSSLERIHPADLATIRMLEEPLFRGDSPVRSVERRYVDLHGATLQTVVTGRLITEPSSGEPVALYTVEDITERRLAEDQARSTEERFRRAALAISTVQEPARVLRAVLESARETLRAEYGAVATYSEDGSAIVQLEVDGMDRGDMLSRIGQWPAGTGVRGVATRTGRPVRVRDVQAEAAFVGFPSGHPTMTTFLAVPIPHHGVGDSTLFLANRLDGAEFTEADETIAAALASHAAVCLDNARVNTRARELVRDLDRANVDLVRANEAKSRFLASVSHELRTPLHAILVASELVSDPPVGPHTDEEVRRLGLTIESSGRHMIHLIDDLVDLSRIEAGRLDIRPTRVMLGDVLVDIGSSFARAAEAQGVSLTLPEGPGQVVYADPVRLRQILTNLISNALKFTARGGRVWVDATVDARGDAHLRPRHR